MVKNSGKALIYTLSLILIILFGNNLTVEAKSSIDKELTIEDTAQLLTNAEKQLIEEEAKKLPEIYKLIILPSAKGSIEETARTYFEHRKFSQDTIMILILTEDKEIFAMTGDALQKKGIDASFFEKQVSDYFVPQAKNGNIATGIEKLMKGISNNIAYQLTEKNEKKDAPKIPEPLKKEVLAHTQIDESDDSSNKTSSLPIFTGIFFAFLIILWLIFKIKNIKNLHS